MEELIAWKSLNGTIYVTQEQAIEGDKKWVTQKLAEDLLEYVKDKMGDRDKMYKLAECRDEVRQMLDKYDALARL